MSETYTITRSALGLAASDNATIPTSIRPFTRPYVNLYPNPDESGFIRSLPELVDFNADKNAEHVFCMQAVKPQAERDASMLGITNAKLKEAITNCIEWLRANVAQLQLPTAVDGGKVVKGMPIALLLESDVGLILHQFALMSLGVPLLLLSARLSPAAISHLLNKTSAVAIIASKRLYNNAAEAVRPFKGNADRIALYTQVQYTEFLAPVVTDKPRSVCIPSHYIGEEDRNVLILHSSGTTGLPKPIYVSHRHLLCFTTCHKLEDEHEAQGVNVSTLPLYHGFGLMAPALAMGVGKTFCLPPTSVVSNATSTIDLIIKSRAASLMSVPSILEDISLDSDGHSAEVLSRLDFVTFGGGTLKTAVGERLTAAGVRILNHYGTTESGPLSPIFKPRSDYDWRFFRLRNDMKLDLREIAAQDGERRFKLTTYPFGWDRPFEIQDQLICNPHQPDTDFNAVGRNDDVIVLATGEKVNPQKLEAMLTELDCVKAAIAFGETQVEIGVIVLSNESLTPEEYQGFRSKIWPAVVRANEVMDDHAKVSSPDAVIILPAGTPIPRTDKGSIARKEAYKTFESLIAAVYQTLQSSTSGVSVTQLDPDDYQTGIKALVQECFRGKLEADQWGPDDDLFELGLDSLQAARLRRFLIAAVPSVNGGDAAQRIGRDFVFTHPSVSRMVNALRETREESRESLSNEIDKLVQRFGMSGIRARASSGKAVVLLTGATGSLGSFCLSSIVKSPMVSRVICLNRPETNVNFARDAMERQRTSVQSKGLELTEDEWSKVTALQATSSKPLLGLTQAEYADIRATVTHILHVAWPMSFKRTLSSFEGAFQTLRNLLDLAREAHGIRPLTRPRLVFISSIATVGRYSDVKGGRIVPEVPITDSDCVNDIGYAKAKLVCEHILEEAMKSHSTELEASYIRFGQLSGSTGSGFWNTDEHFAALVKSSQRIGALPQLQGTFSWIPVDKAGSVVTELLLHERPPALVYHVENPVRQSWKDALQALSSSLNIAGSMGFAEWLHTVDQAVDEDPEKNPAKKLLDFFQLDFERMSSGKVIMGTDAARAASPTLRSLDVVEPASLTRYIDYWRKIDFLA